MKLCVVILSGAGDLPLEVLDGRTPLSAARMPALTALLAEGRTGGVRSVPKKVPVSTAAALASLLGRDLTAGAPSPGGLLASALGVEIGASETAFRCDLVNLFDGKLVDPTAGGIGPKESERLVQALADGLGAGGPGAGGSESGGIRIVPGDRWRALLVAPREPAGSAVTEQPGSAVGRPVRAHRPRGRGGNLLASLMERGEAILAAHEVNAVRVDLGENPANGIWIWGGGSPPEPFGRSGPETGKAAAVGRHPSFLGVAKAAGLTPRRVDESDADVIGRAAVRAAGEADLTAVHAGGLLDASRRGDAPGKLGHLEELDRAVIRPLADLLVAGGRGRLLVVASHVASSESRRDEEGVVPFVLAGSGAKGYGEASFTEEGAAASDLVVEHGHELLEFALRA